MSEARVTLIASAITLITGALWGLYWLPVRALDGHGLAGAWGTVAITGVACAAMGPVAWAKRAELATATPAALASVALGGAAFALYSIGFLYGRVALVILLWFLTPVWSVLIGRFVMGWPVSRLRMAAIVVGLSGLGLMLGAGGGLPLPSSLGEWMTLLGGVIWSVATTGMRTRSTLSPGPATFTFAAGAALTALCLAPFLAPLPASGVDWAAALGLTISAGVFWWGAATAALMWATVRLEPARIGILLMSEVLVGAVSAALIAGELLSAMEIAGGALVLAAGLLEVWPARPAQRPA
ncbi:DMT family transporter [Thioclava nitratireducens]|uniref:DMT family transporter n=1 Tax=Thioclava nitratireducens TaxID=1915078 RepID=UPI002480814B|nr:DMT family transporter [Thioclava nitratireducens]WGT49385.1 DMT family transporter [Thioclava nitratireducens]